MGNCKAKIYDMLVSRNQKSREFYKSIRQFIKHDPYTFPYYTRIKEVGAWGESKIWSFKKDMLDNRRHCLFEIKFS